MCSLEDPAVPAQAVFAFDAFAGNTRGDAALAQITSASSCSGLMYPDTNLGENARHREVFDEQAKTYIFP